MTYMSRKRPNKRNSLINARALGRTPGPLAIFGPHLQFSAQKTGLGMPEGAAFYALDFFGKCAHRPSSRWCCNVKSALSGRCIGKTTYAKVKKTRRLKLGDLTGTPPDPRANFRGLNVDIAKGRQVWGGLR